MLYGHSIAATVMTLDVCQGRSFIARFSILTCTLRSPSAIAELLLSFINVKANFYDYNLQANLLFFAGLTRWLLLKNWF